MGTAEFKAFIYILSYRYCRSAGQSRHAAPCLAGPGIFARSLRSSLKLECAISDDSPIAMAPFSSSDQVRGSRVRPYQTGVTLCFRIEAKSSLFLGKVH